MSVDLEQFSRAELEELAAEQSEELAALRADVEDLHHDLDDLTGLMEAYNRQLQTIKTVLMGEDPDGLASLDGYGDGYNLIGRLGDLERHLDDVDERLHHVPKKPAEQTDTESRLHAIRKYLVERAAAENTNIYAVDYTEIRALFDGEISDSWASQLMRRAAGTFPDDPDDAKHGFEIADLDPKNKLRVHIDQVQDRSLLRLKKD